MYLLDHIKHRFILPVVEGYEYHRLSKGDWLLNQLWSHIVIPNMDIVSDNVEKQGIISVRGSIPDLVCSYK